MAVHLLNIPSTINDLRRLTYPVSDRTRYNLVAWCIRTLKLTHGCVSRLNTIIRDAG
jgi:hypothetical protein